MNRLLVLLSIIFFAAGGVTEAYENQVRIWTDNHYRYIQSNGIPDHSYGRFPNSGNPNKVSPQNHSYRISLNPQLTGRVVENSMGLFGVALNGVPFDPGTAEFWQNNPSSGWHYDALSGKLNLGIDMNNAHVQPTGAYHYHGIPDVLVKRANSAAHSNLIGYAADGFPIYALYGYINSQDPLSGVHALKPGFQLKKGSRPGGPGGNYDGTFNEDFSFIEGSGDLDICNGRFGITPEYPDGTYAYFLTDTYPFVPRCFSGTPDSSFMMHGGPAAGSAGGTGNQHRHPDLRQAAARLGVSFDALRQAMGPPPPDFAQAARRLGISEEKLREAVLSA